MFVFLLATKMMGCVFPAPFFKSWQFGERQIVVSNCQFNERLICFYSSRNARKVVSVGGPDNFTTCVAPPSHMICNMHNVLEIHAMI